MAIVLAAIVVSLVVVATAFGNFPQSTEVTVPAGGEGTVTSSPLPATATAATITVTPSSPADTQLFDSLTETLSTATSPKARVLTCVFIYAALKLIYLEAPPSYTESDPSLQLLFLQACLELAFKVSQPPQGGTRAASDASAACPQRNLGVGMRVSGSAGHYVVHVAGSAHKAARRSALVVSCQRAGPGIQINLRPRARGRTLRQAVGPTLGIGFFNPSTGGSVHVNTTFSVR